jgi:hypothetical protein
MQTLNVLGAKAIWLFDIDDLNPRGKDIVSELLEWIKENYYFEKAPASVDQLDPEKKSLKFERGRFQVKEEIFIAVDLEIYKDGFVANSRSSTNDTDKFVDDLLTAASKEFSLPYSSGIVRNKMYTSELTVRLEFPLFNLNPKLTDVAHTISALCGLPVPPFELSRLGFSTDMAISHLKPAPFLLERRIGSPFDEKRYYSQAPLHTAQHEELLVEIEHILSAG